LSSDPAAAAHYEALLRAFGERVKELSALRGAASMLLHDEPAPELLQRIAGILPASMQYPDITAARAVYGDDEAVTANFRESAWTITSTFATGDGVRGELQVVYLEQWWQPGTVPFLEEESNLLDAIADMMRSHFERRRVEGALRAGESLLRSAGRVAKFGGWRIDLPSFTLVWSDEVRALHDLPPGAAPGMEDAIGFYAPEYRDMARRLIDDCVRLGTPFDFEARMVTARGRSIWVRTIGEAAHGPNGAITGIQGALQDISARKQAEQALRESQERYQLAMHGSAAGLWDWNLRTQEVYWSPRLKEMLGYDHSTFSVSLEAFLDSLHPDDRDDSWAQIQQHLRHRTPYQAHIRIRTSSGAYGWFYTSGQALWDEDGQPYRMAGSVVDVTARREAEQEARRLAEQLTSTLESITDAFFTLDDEWRFTYLNREAERQFARSREELIGREIWAEYPGSLGTTFEIEYRRAVASQTTVEFEEFFPPLRAWYSVRAYPSEHGLTVYFHNVTRQREAREEARTSEERFRLLARATNDAIWDWDLATNSLWWNEGFETLFGYRREEIEATTRSWTTRVHPEERGAVISSLERAIADGADAWSAEYRFRRNDGSYAFVLDRGHIIRDPLGVPVRMIGGMTDLTERKKLEAQFLRTQRMESIGTLAGGIAHDLNNVLTPIVMSVALLKEDETDAVRREMLNSIEASAQRGAAMVRQVLAFARGVAGRAAPVNVLHLVRDVQKIVRDTFPKDIELAIESVPELWTVQADATQLHQVLMNLCLNARDAMPEGGQLLLQLRNVVLDDVPSGMSPACGPGPYVVLIVTDTGAGMPREVQERVFEPFFTTKEVGKGTGLGLSTALTIVKSHGGFIDIVSEVNAGTSVKVYLPVKDTVAAAEPDAPAPVRRTGGDGELVLVVDDEEGIRSMTRRMLERFGYRVMMASNGAEAVALYVQHQSDVAVVITDMAMPVMDGPATIFALKAIEPDVRIIASSGHTVNDAVAQALSAGVQHFIPKPYTADVMLRALEELLGKTR
jgi:PAS domain S-box-containing protein